MKSLEVENIMHLLFECKGLLKSGDVCGMRTKISALRNTYERALEDRLDMGFSNCVACGVCGKLPPSSGFLKETTDKSNERLLYLNRLRSEIDNLEVSYFILKGTNKFYAGEHESAFSLWEDALRKSPADKFIHHRLSDAIGQTKTDIQNKKRLEKIAAGLKRRYCFEEDVGFWQGLKTRLPDPAVRCIDFDDDGSMYLNCVDKHSVVKLNSNGEIQWEICFNKLTNPSRFGSFCFSGGQLILCDAPNRQLIFLTKDGDTERTVPLQLGIPIFAHHVEELGQYHITDEKTGKVHILDDRFREIGAYKSPDDALRPIQVVLAKGINKMVLASSLVSLRSTLDVFDMDGNHENTITSFSESPCHVAKLDMDECGEIYAADHFGRIFKINTAGEVIWRYQESQRTDRFKYVKYRRPYLYISDFHTVRRFRVDR